MTGPLSGKVCLVTGATRGIGKGIALQLGEAGATVYITGRTLKSKSGATAGSLEDTASEIKARGGKCVAIVCDHRDDSQVESVFERIKKEQDGQLDLLVNNAYSAAATILNNVGRPFWEQDIGLWDEVNNVGLRNTYICMVHAARMMVNHQKGLIINISSFGGLLYLFNVAYGIGKQAVDRMAVDCGYELRKHNVAVISLWPGPAKTEVISDTVLQDSFQSEYMQPGVGKVNPNMIKTFFANGETMEFSGKCVVQLMQDPKIMKKSGRIVMTCDLAEEYGFKDVDGCQIPNSRSVNHLLKTIRWNKLAFFFPCWVKIPTMLLNLVGNKFY